MNGTTQQTIAQEAGSWVFRLKDDSSTECREEFTAWLLHSPQHVVEFLLATATDTELGALEGQQHIDIEALLTDEGACTVVPLAGLTRHPAATVNTDIPRDRFVAQPGPQPSSPSKSRPGFPARWRWTAAAAALATVSVLTGALWWSGFFAAQELRTRVGEQRTVKLTDGSVVQLNTRSRMQVRFSDEARIIHLLEGEALFTVAQESARPFLVRSGSTTVQAIGTQFNVYRHTQGATVSVLEGRVKIESEVHTHGASPEPEHAVLLNAGQQAAIEPGGRIDRVNSPQIDRAMAWRQRHLEFRSATVSEVAAEFNRYNRMQLKIADQELAARRMSGRFKADEPQSLLDFLTRSGVRLQRQGDAVTLITATSTALPAGR